ncbi:hypothetical protein B1813_04390 [Saccharomonospora piscinae]|uniref:CU044_5270 family protein n=1 Tax=Saccharomonospora piscinae TaxID=687388 RepID=A0A1V9AA25_SACPI|nr:CU044_5270 family protein [Saccharomonospora piscinae]OQO93774.1 hypothetical protein B1813_04390 [Saccharomonospora piscinae]
MSRHDPGGTGGVSRVWTEAELDEALDALHADVRADEAVVERARSGLPPTSECGPLPRRRGPSRWWVAAAVAGLVAAGATVTQILPSGDGVGVSAAATLERASGSAAGLATTPGRYRYVETHAWWITTTEVDGARFAWRSEHLRETWVPHRQTDEWWHRRDVTGEREWVLGSEEQARAAGVEFTPGEVDEGEWRVPCGDWFAEQPCTRPGGWHNPTPEWQAGLPRDPGALLDRLRRDAPDNTRGDVELLVLAAQALRSGLLTEEVRSALYAALASLPGLEVTAERANVDGRVGTALGMDDGTVLEEIIIDPDTGRFLGDRQVASGGSDLPEGTVLSYTAVSVSVVDAAGKRPEG